MSAPGAPVLTGMLTYRGAPFSKRVRASGSCFDTKAYVYGSALTFWAVASASRAVHTRVPASPSAVSPCWFSKFITAPLVITFSEPSVHSAIKDAGVPGHLQAKVPVWAVAASIGEVGGPAGAKERGR